MKRAVFLDRDGTLLDEEGYLARPQDLRMLPGAAEGVARFNRAGWLTVLVTNQSGIARGLFDEAALQAVHERLRAELERGGAHLDAILYCPHHPEVGAQPWRVECDCRKPKAGMLLDAAARLELDLASCWTVGDSQRDIEAGRRAGLAGAVLVLTGKGLREREGLTQDAWLRTALDLPAAAEIVLAAADALPAQKPG